MLTAKQKVLWMKIRLAASDRLSAMADALLFALHIPACAKATPGNKKAIAFTGEFLPPRIPRMAKWLKRSGNYFTILLCKKNGFVPEFAGHDFDRIHLFRNAWHLKRLLRSLGKTDIIHGFAPKSHYGNVARKFSKATYIHDMQDVYTIYYGTNPSMRWLRAELPHERECLLYADGVVAHCLEANVALRVLKADPKPPTLYFPLYCDDDCFIRDAKKISDTEIHLVYAGGVAGSHRDPKHYGNIQFHKLIETLTAQGLHFHIYPSPSSNRTDYEEYEVISKTNARFHFHQPVAQENLSRELSQYHFGIHLGFINDASHKQSVLKYKYCTTLKLFNFIEAGLPMIISENLTYQAWMSTRYGGGISITRENVEELGRMLKQIDYGERQQKLYAGREQLSLKKHIKRLDSFYQKIKSGR